MKKYVYTTTYITSILHEKLIHLKDRNMSLKTNHVITFIRSNEKILVCLHFSQPIIFSHFDIHNNLIFTNFARAL